MNVTAFMAMGSRWWVEADTDVLTRGVEDEVARWERLLSRFRPDSALSRLNAARRWEDAELARVVTVALEARAATGGCFDPTLGAELAAWGYDQCFVPRGERRGHGPAARSRLDVRVEGATVILDGDGLLDLGGIGKGWAVDRAVDWLRARGCANALVDGGGDLRGFGALRTLGLPDGGAVDLVEGALATSSTLRRRWAGADGRLVHHLLDPATGAPSRGEVHTVTVQATTAVEAEVWAKAVLLRPGTVPDCIRAGRAVWLGMDDGEWWTSQPEMSA